MGDMNETEFDIVREVLSVIVSRGDYRKDTAVLYAAQIPGDRLKGLAAGESFRPSDRSALLEILNDERLKSEYEKRFETAAEARRRAFEEVRGFYKLCEMLKRYNLKLRPEQMERSERPSMGKVVLRCFTWVETVQAGSARSSLPASR